MDQIERTISQLAAVEMLGRIQRRARSMTAIEFGGAGPNEDDQALVRQALHDRLIAAYPARLGSVVWHTYDGGAARDMLAKMGRSDDEAAIGLVEVPRRDAWLRLDPRLGRRPRVRRMTVGVRLDEDERAAMELLVDFMRTVDSWGLRPALRGELVAAIHPLQGFVIQHMLQRAAPDDRSRWYER